MRDRFSGDKGLAQDEEDYGRMKLEEARRRLVSVGIYEDISNFFIMIARNEHPFMCNVPKNHDFDTANFEYLSVARWLKRYLKKSKEIYYINGNFVVWGREKSIPRLEDPFIGEIALERFLRK